MREKINRLIPIALALALFMPFASYADPILSIAPPFQQGNIGDTFSVNLVISNLGPTEEIGGFDVDISFNTGILAPLAITLGSGLGTGANQVTLANSFAGGVADIAQFSFLDAATLKGLQGSSFTLATLTFQGIANGLSPLTITQAIFADGDFNTIQLQSQIQNGSIQVGDAAPIPEPSTILLMGSGIAALAFLRSRRK